MKIFICVLGVILLPLSLTGEDCINDANDVITTDHYFYQASSDQGAVGDVVAIEFSLTLENIHPVIDGVSEDLLGFNLVGCYDSEALELLGDVYYSDLYDKFAFLSLFYPEGGDASRPKNTPLGAFRLGATTLKNGIQLLSEGQAFPLMTLYFRVKGQPGSETTIRFCDDKRVTWISCEANELTYCCADAQRHGSATRSTLHRSGTVRILPGAPTRPDPPPAPINAKVYPEAPTPGSAQIRFELEGPSVARPGASDLPFALYITSNYEFSGFMTAVRFPSQYMELTRVEEHTRPGIVASDNTEGGFGILMANGRRRVGAEGERVHVATLYFNVKESAQGTDQLELRFEPFQNFINWLAIYYSQSLNGDTLPVTAEVNPVFVAHPLIKVQTRPTRPGDVNLDYELNISDPISLLDHLFLGGEDLFCAKAADFNADGQVNISDAIALLNHLFLGAAGRAGDIYCN
jgi:hypothetical protein